MTSVDYMNGWEEARKIKDQNRSRADQGDQYLEDCLDYWIWKGVSKDFCRGFGDFVNISIVMES